MSPPYTIEYHNLYVILRNIDPLDRLRLPSMLSKFEVHKAPNNFKRGRRGNIPPPAPAKFYSTTKNHDEIRVHRNYSKSLIGWLLSIGKDKDSIKLEEAPMHQLDKIKVKMRAKFKPRDYQQPYIDWMLNTDYPNLLELKPGDGKTFMGTYVTYKLGYRTVIIVKARWVQKWFNDIQELTTCKPEEILTIQGSAQLNNAFELFNANKGKKYKYVIISNRTMQNFITTYERSIDPDEIWEYAIYPEEYMKCFKAGTLLLDEVHLDFNLNYKIMLYTDAVKLIAMTGTYNSDNPTLRNIENTVFPLDQRMAARKRDKFTYVTAVSYMLAPYVNIQPYNYSTSSGYNHIKYEMFILNRPAMLIDYTNMILNYVKSHYMDVRKPKDKCMVFASSIPMCTYLVMVLKYKLKDVIVGRYVEDDSYDNVLESDITVSTVLSSGTAFDIPNLITVIQTIAISSSQSNLQNVGRLRKLKNRDVRFVYFYTPGIDKQIHYHYKRRALLSEEAIEYHIETYEKPIGSSDISLRSGEFDRNIVETVFSVYAMAQYVTKTYPGVISKLSKELSGDGKPIGVAEQKWKRKNLTRKRSELAKYEYILPEVEIIAKKLLPNK